MHKRKTLVSQQMRGLDLPNRKAEKPEKAPVREVLDTRDRVAGVVEKLMGTPKDAGLAAAGPVLKSSTVIPFKMLLMRTPNTS